MAVNGGGGVYRTTAGLRLFFCRAHGYSLYTISSLLTLLLNCYLPACRRRSVQGRIGHYNMVILYFFLYTLTNPRFLFCSYSFVLRIKMLCFTSTMYSVLFEHLQFKVL